jgi:hypothetical protein
LQQGPASLGHIRCALFPGGLSNARQGDKYTKSWSFQSPLSDVQFVRGEEEEDEIPAIHPQIYPSRQYGP